MTTIESSKTSVGYDGVSVGLHWIIALFLVVLFVGGQFHEALPQAQRGVVMDWHKAGGVVVLALVLLRTLWRVTHPAPELIKTSPLLDTTAKAVHGLLYLLLIAMPVTGLAMVIAAGRGVTLLGIPPLMEKSPELAKAFSNAHGLIIDGILVLVFVHVVAALWHQYFRHDGTLARMAPWLRARS
ncbi:MAG TPA: cytochrome b [Rhodopseudomonas sp.]|uniref:cytochrome b n=1 Tax=Rhodopseudomonas sp. TaxID=1078 RepID=UPI002ED925DB